MDHRAVSAEGRNKVVVTQQLVVNADLGTIEVNVGPGALVTLWLDQITDRQRAEQGGVVHHRMAGCGGRNCFDRVTARIELVAKPDGAACSRDGAASKDGSITEEGIINPDIRIIESDVHIGTSDAMGNDVVFYGWFNDGHTIGHRICAVGSSINGHHGINSAGDIGSEKKWLACTHQAVQLNGPIEHQSVFFTGLGTIQTHHGRSAGIARG